jgi:hypothetical protein
MHDIISKRIKEDVASWDLYLNQMLAAIRFHVNESTKYHYPLESEVLNHTSEKFLQLKDGLYYQLTYQVLQRLPETQNINQ